MPNGKKNTQGSGKVKDLKPRKSAAGKAENVKGGFGQRLDDSASATPTRLAGSVGSKLAGAGSTVMGAIGTQSGGAGA